MFTVKISQCQVYDDSNLPKKELAVWAFQEISLYPLDVRKMSFLEGFAFRRRKLVNRHTLAGNKYLFGCYMNKSGCRCVTEAFGAHLCSTTEDCEGWWLSRLVVGGMHNHRVVLIARFTCC